MIAWRMSINYNRERHPLIQNNKRKRKRRHSTSCRNQDDDTTICTGSKQQKGSVEEKSVPNTCKTKITMSVPEPDLVHISILDIVQRSMTTG
jgi:hypothetical protein